MRDQRLLLSPPLAGAGASCAAVVVDQLELAAAADGGWRSRLGRRLRGCGLRRRGGGLRRRRRGRGRAGHRAEPAGQTVAAARFRRLLPVGDGGAPCARRRVGSAGRRRARVRCARGSASPLLALDAACALGANFGREGGNGGRVGWPAAALGDQAPRRRRRPCGAAAISASPSRLRAGGLIGKPTIDQRLDLSGAGRPSQIAAPRSAMARARLPHLAIGDAHADRAPWRHRSASCVVGIDGRGELAHRRRRICPAAKEAAPFFRPLSSAWTEIEAKR